MMLTIRYKFMNNVLRGQFLQNTRSCLLEMSPYDCFWGTGLFMKSDNRKTILTNAPNMSGQHNKLGQILMLHRDELSGIDSYSSYYRDTDTTPYYKRPDTRTMMI